MSEIAIQSGAAHDAVIAGSSVLRRRGTHDTSDYGRAIFRRWMLQTSATSIAGLGVLVGLVELVGLIRGL
jgi:hypothetical protein